MAGKFEPKVPVNLNPPKDDPITLEELAQADGESFGACIVMFEHPFSVASFIIETSEGH